MPNRAVFLDRDNTLIEDPGYINNPDQVKLLSGVAKPLIELKKMGYKLVVVTNQSGVARGIVTEKVLGEIHNRLKQILAENGVYLDQIYYCPYHPEGVVSKYRKESKMRKPNPGMLLSAANEMDIDLNQSWMVGNSGRDIEAGQRAGCRTILVELASHQRSLGMGKLKPDYKAVNMKEAVNIVKKHERSRDKVAVQAQPVPKTEPEPQLRGVEEEQQQNQSLETKVCQEDSSEMDMSSEIDISSESSEILLKSILEQLKRMQRNTMFGEFSIMRLLAGVIQIIVLGCLLISIWFLMSPTKHESSILISLGFAMVLQMMSLSFYIMQGRK